MKIFLYIFSKYIRYINIYTYNIHIQSCLVYTHTLVPTCFGRINGACGLLNHTNIAHILTIGNFMYMYLCVVCIYFQADVGLYIYVHMIIRHPVASHLAKQTFRCIDTSPNNHLAAVLLGSSVCRDKIYNQ